jgi:hypothetical protein
MFEVLSKMRSSIIVPQGNPPLATGLCLSTAGCCTPVTLRPSPFRTIGLCRRCLAVGQAHCT